jgi:hypothetical protein
MPLQCPNPYRCIVRLFSNTRSSDLPSCPAQCLPNRLPSPYLHINLPCSILTVSSLRIIDPSSVLCLAFLRLTGSHGPVWMWRFSCPPLDQDRGNEEECQPIRIDDEMLLFRMPEAVAFRLQSASKVIGTGMCMTSMRHQHSMLRVMFPHHPDVPVHTGMHSPWKTRQQQWK